MTRESGEIRTGVKTGAVVDEDEVIRKARDRVRWAGKSTRRLRASPLMMKSPRKICGLEHTAQHTAFRQLSSDSE